MAKKSLTFSLVGSGLAGALYNSWPLGYWLNPVIARRGLASALEAPHQPYNWLFVLLDIVSSLLIAAVVYRAALGPGRAAGGPGQAGGRPHRRDWLVFGFVALFAIGTIADALLPEGCIPEVQQCGSLTHNWPLLIHGFFSVSAAVCLFFSLAAAWWYRRRSLVIGLFLVGYAVFGIISLVQAIDPGSAGNGSQHYYLTLCGAWLAYLPWAIWRIDAKTEKC